MTGQREAFVGIDAAKLRNAVAIADAGRDGEVRYLGEFDASPEGMRRLVVKLSRTYGRLHFCYGWRHCRQRADGVWALPAAQRAGT